MPRRRAGQRRLVRSVLGDSASQPPPDGAEDRTSAFRESTRPRRHAVAVGAGAGCGRLLSVDSERPVQGPEMTKASVGLVQADARVRGQASAALATPVN